MKKSNSEFDLENIKPVELNLLNGIPKEKKFNIV